MMIDALSKGGKRSLYAQFFLPNLYPQPQDQLNDEHILTSVDIALSSSHCDSRIPGAEMGLWGGG
jgi:hypothetical protein